MVSALQLTPALVVLGFFVAAPLVVFAIYSVWKLREFQIVSEWNLDNYKEAVSSDVFRTLMWNTVKIAGMVGIAISAGLLVGPAGRRQNGAGNSCSVRGEEYRDAPLILSVTEQSRAGRPSRRDE